MSSSQPVAPVGGSQTVVQQILPREETLVLRLSTPAAVPEPDDRPHVTWAADVIDNEHLGRLKSNCCCIYTKPRRWDDPSTWEQDEHETEHCRGHTLPDPVDNNKEPNEEKDESRSPCHGIGCC